MIMRENMEIKILGTGCPKFKALEKLTHEVVEQNGIRLHAGFKDPSKVTGTEEYIWSEFHKVRDEIKTLFYKFYFENIKKQ